MHVGALARRHKEISGNTRFVGVTELRLHIATALERPGTPTTTDVAAYLTEANVATAIP